MFLTILKPFCGILILRQLLKVFSTFFRGYFQPQKYFKKVENFRIYGPVFEFLAQKTFVNMTVNPKLFDIFEIFLGLEISTEKSIKTVNNCLKIKMPQKGFKIVKNIFFSRKTLFFFKKTRKQVRKS